MTCPLQEICVNRAMIAKTDGKCTGAAVPQAGEPDKVALLQGYNYAGHHLCNFDIKKLQSPAFSLCTAPEKPSPTRGRRGEMKRESYHAQGGLVGHPDGLHSKEVGDDGPLPRVIRDGSCQDNLLHLVARPQHRLQ